MSPIKVLSRYSPGRTEGNYENVNDIVSSAVIQNINQECYHYTSFFGFVALFYKDLISY
jgi:hypothetical protein